MTNQNNQQEELQLGSFVSLVSEKMQDPIQKIASAAGFLGEKLKEEEISLPVHKDLSSVVKSLKTLNDYNKALYKYSLISKKDIYLEEVRLIDVFLEFKEYLKISHNLKVSTLLSDVFVMADFELLLKSLKELVSDLLLNSPKFDQPNLDIYTTTKNQHVYIHINCQSNVSPAIQDHDEAGENNSLLYDVHFVLAQKMIADLGGNLVGRDFEDGRKEYTIVLKKLIGVPRFMMMEA